MSVTFQPYTDKEKVTFQGRDYNKPIPMEGDFNLANANAAALLGLLGLFDDPDEDFVGDIRIDDLQARIDVAQAFWEDEGVKFTRDEERGKNWISFGLDANDLKKRLDRFASFVAYAKQRGATGFSWA